MAQDLLGESDDSLGEETTAEDVLREVAAHERLFHDETTPASELLVRLHGHTLEEERAVLVLEFFDGVELHSHVQAARVHSAGWLREDEARAYAALLCDALAHAHSAGVAHLDLKPQNVLVQPAARRLKLIDYGFSASRV